MSEIDKKRTAPGEESTAISKDKILAPKFGNNSELVQNPESSGELDRTPIAIGKWLKVAPFLNRRTGSISYRISGQLPFFEGTPPPDLVEWLEDGFLPKPIRINREDQSLAINLMNRLEDACRGRATQAHCVETRLPKSIVEGFERAADILKPFLRSDPNAMEEAARLYAAKYGNVLRDVTLLHLVSELYNESGNRISLSIQKQYNTAITAICAEYGFETKAYDARNRPKKDIYLRELTKELLQKYYDADPVDKRRLYLGKIGRILSLAVKGGYLYSNPMVGVDLTPTKEDRLKEAEEDIITDSNEQVQIALNMAADFEGGRFVPHVVLFYYGAVRPLSELRRIKAKWINLRKKWVRVISTKTATRRVLYLSTNSVEMIKHYWDGKDLTFEGWEAFWRLVRAAQGYGVEVPKWFQRPEGPIIPHDPRSPRHTGASHYSNWEANLDRAARRNGHRVPVFEGFYNGVIPDELSAIFYSLFPAPQNVTSEVKESILKELIARNLLPPDSKYPQKPEVPTFCVNPPRNPLWLPDVSDADLQDIVWRLGFRKAAKKLGTNEPWLTNIYRVKCLPSPPPGRRPSIIPKSTPRPEPVLNISNLELEKLIKDCHGAAAAAEVLGIPEDILRAYCTVYGVVLPSKREIAAYWNKLPRVRSSPRQVESLLSRLPFDQVAKDLKVEPEQLRVFCDRWGISVFQTTACLNSALDLDDLASGLKHKLLQQSNPALETDRLMVQVLENVPQGLMEDELISVFSKLGFPLSKGTIAYTVREAAKGTFEMSKGRIRLLGNNVTAINLNDLKLQIEKDIQTRNEWSILDASRCVLSKVADGLTAEELLETLAWFGVAPSLSILKRELVRFKRQGRLHFFWGKVFLPKVSNGHFLRVADRDPTPDLREIEAQVKTGYEQLASKELTNVEVMEFVLSKAPSGLAQEEFLSITRSLGVDFKESCIHSVIHHETKNRFKTFNGRLTLIGSCQARATLDDVNRAVELCRSTPVVRGDRRDLILQILSQFPNGIWRDELAVVLSRLNQCPKRDALKKQVQLMAKAGLLVSDYGFLTLPCQHVTALAG